MVSTRVQYDLGDEPVTELPPQETGHRTSALRGKVQEMFDDPKWHSPNPEGRPIFRPLAQYEVGGSASGAMQSLRNHFGREGSGFTFVTRRSGDTTIMYASFNPSTRVEGFPEPGLVPRVPAQNGRGRPKVAEGEVAAEQPV